MTKYWISVRAVRGTGFTRDVDIGATRYLKIPEDQVPSPEHGIRLSQWLKDLISSFPTAPSPVDGRPVPTGDIVFLVHGYNNSVLDIDRAQQRVKQGMLNNTFPCQVICFDWPSGQNALAYLRDLDHARMTAIRLVKAGVKPFITASTHDCNIRVHAVGYSMGAFVLREAFDHADDGASTDVNWTVNQLVMFAGDVDQLSFSENDADTESMYRHCTRLTSYFNGFDEILQISNAKRLGLEPRLGRIGLPDNAPSKSANVDCSAYFENTYAAQAGTQEYPVLTHSWYLSDSLFMKDLAFVLRGGIDRQKIPTRGSGPGRTQILDGTKAQPVVMAVR